MLGQLWTCGKAESIRRGRRTGQGEVAHFVAKTQEEEACRTKQALQRNARDWLYQIPCEPVIFKSSID